MGLELAGMKTQMGSVKDLKKLAGLKEWLNGEGREQEFSVTLESLARAQHQQVRWAQWEDWA